VLPLAKGPNSDEFFLTFDTIGSNTFNRPPPATPPLPPPTDLPPASAIGVRTFDRISASMSAITGVSENTGPVGAGDAGIQATFAGIRQSLPAIPDIQAVLASHQVAIAQLAIEYCNALIENHQTTFPSFNFNAAPSAAFPANENALFDPLLDRVLGGTQQLADQPSRSAVSTELHNMVNGYPGDLTRPGLLNTGSPTDPTRTRAIAKAVCSAVVGSAPMLVQ
jgi:hypothetical protein